MSAPAAVERLSPVRAARRDFPLLARAADGRPLAFLDSAASAQKPRAVLDAVRSFYEEEYANVHRGVYELSARATERYEGARATAAAFLGAAGPEEIVFTRGATEAINLAAASLGRGGLLKEGDEVVLTVLEHHSNIVPWQMLRDAAGIRIRVARADADGNVDEDAVFAETGPATRMIAFAHVANTTGTVLPARAICRRAREAGILTLVDGCQAVPHAAVDVADLGCDFYVFSGHKLYGPTGTGVLYGRAELLRAMPPWQGGGEMIREVTFARTTYADPPARFEAGTPNIAGAVGLAAALDYVGALGLAAIARHEEEVLAHGLGLLRGAEGVRIVGEPERRAGAVSFVIDGVHPHDAGTVLDRAGVAVRVGHHCAQPAMEHFGVQATIRASVGLYNDESDFDALAEGLGQVREILGR